MNALLSELDQHVFLITLNRVEKHNAFDDEILLELQCLLDEAIANPDVRVILLKASGKHFCAGADLGWMKRMASFSEAENIADAQVLARVMHTLYHAPKPTIAMVQGAAFGGGAGLVAACDVAIASTSAHFCFSEVKLGLIPAVISPYVIQSIGEKAAAWLFMSAEPFDAPRALELNLVQKCVEDEKLLSYALEFARKMARLPTQAVCAAKSLVRDVSGRPIDEALQHLTARLIAAQRITSDAQIRLHAFLNKDTPHV